jgi:hypothetical protein
MSNEEIKKKTILKKQKNKLTQVYSSHHIKSIT